MHRLFPLFQCHCDLVSRERSCMLTQTPRIHSYNKCDVVKHVENQTNSLTNCRKGKKRGMDYVSFITNHRSPLLKGLESSLPCLRQGLWQTERGRKVNRKQNGVLSSCPDSCTQMRRRALASGQEQKAGRSGTRSSFNEKVVEKSLKNESTNNHRPNLHLICIKCILMRLICICFL